MFDVDSSTLVETTPSKAPSSKSTAPASSQLSPRVPTNIIENEDLAWECFEKVVSSEDITTCYDMSLKDFEHFGVHDHFKVCDCFLSRLLFYDFVSSNHHILSFTFI